MFNLNSIPCLSQFHLSHQHFAIHGYHKSVPPTNSGDSETAAMPSNAVVFPADFTMNQSGRFHEGSCQLGGCTAWVTMRLHPRSNAPCVGCVTHRFFMLEHEMAEASSGTLRERIHNQFLSRHQSPSTSAKCVKKSIPLKAHLRQSQNVTVK